MGDPEIVFKYRHPNVQQAAEVDVRPHIGGRLPGQVQSRGAAVEASTRWIPHAVLSQHSVPAECGAASRLPVDGDRARGAPRVTGAEAPRDGTHRAREQRGHRGDSGHDRPPYFGKHVGAKASVSLWRTRGDLQQLVGEFSFQIRLRQSVELPDKVVKRCEKFFVELQRGTSTWMAPGTTKTGTVYALKAHAPRSHE